MPGFAQIAVAVLALTIVVPATGQVTVTPVIKGDRVYASFSAAATLTEEVRKAVLSGLMVTFEYAADLRRGSAVWFDRTLASAAVSSTVKYDTLTRTFQISKFTAGKLVSSATTDQEDQMRRWATDFEQVPLGAAAPLEPNADYYIRVRVRAQPRRTFSLWPWGSYDATGRADFTFVR